MQMCTFAFRFILAYVPPPHNKSWHNTGATAMINILQETLCETESESERKLSSEI